MPARAPVRIPLIGIYNSRDDTVQKDGRLVNAYPERVVNTLRVKKRPGILNDTTVVSGGGAARLITECNISPGTAVTVIGSEVYSGTTKVGDLKTSTGKVFFDILNVSGLLYNIYSDGTYLYTQESDDSLFRVISQRSLSGRTSNVTGVTIVFIENDTATGAGTLSFTAAGTTATWAENGDSAGAAVNIGAATGYYTLASNNGNEIDIHSAVGSLPGTDQSDTLTVQDNSNIPTSHVGGLVVFDYYIFVVDENGTIYNSEVDDPYDWTDTTFFIDTEIEADTAKGIRRHEQYLVIFGTDTLEFFYDAANESGSPLSRVPEVISDWGISSINSLVRAEDNLFWIGTYKDSYSVFTFKGLQPTKISTEGIDRLLEGESGIATVAGFQIGIDGHNFYVINLTNSNITLLYDIKNQYWLEFSSYDGATETYFKYYDSQSISGVVKLLHESDGKIYKLDTSTYQDVGNIIKTKGVLEKFDQGNNYNKTCERFEVIGDLTTSSANLSVSWSDDDYKNFTTARTVDLSSRPILTRLGRFQRRAYKWEFDANLPLRLEAFEMHLSQGGYGA